MRRGSLEQTLPDIRLAQQQLDILLGPVARREGLQEHHDFLKVHLDQLVGPFHQEGGADVEVEFREAVFFRHVCVPHSDGVSDADLPHEETVHPPEGELYELDVFLFKVLC